MSLIDKIIRSNTIPNEDQIGGHMFEAVFWLWMNGHLTDQNIINVFNLTSNEFTKLQEISSNFQSAADKIKFFFDLWSATLLVQNQLISRNKYLNILGITE